MIISFCLDVRLKLLRQIVTYKQNFLNSMQYLNYIKSHNILSNFSSNIMTSQIKLGHYTLGRTIGQGGFAKVKVGKHDITGIEVAVKIINKKKMKNKNMISKVINKRIQVKRQIQILKLITHPNIIKLYEVLDTTNDIFVIMELANRGQLYEYFFDKPSSEQEVCYYFNQIINGLEYIHRNRIAHRDLKPENILIDANNLIKIGDFGLSNIMKDGKLLKTFCGSLSYAAPQIINETKYQGTSIDVWSCGVILFFLLTKKFPFQDEVVTRLYKKMEYGLYQIPFQLSTPVKDLIKRMLQFDPRNRISLQEIKVHPWIRTQIPIYMRIPQESFIEKQKKSQIDSYVLEEVKSLNLNFRGYTEQKIKKIISNKDNESFVVTYQLLKTQKDKKKYEKKIEQSKNQDFTIFKNINNKVKNNKNKSQILPNHEKFLYGRIFNKSPKFLAEKIMEFLRKQNIQYQIKSEQYCIKCNYQVMKQESGSYQMTEETEEDSELSKKQGKWSINILKFTIQIYEVNRKNQVHLVDITLNQGHPFLFFPLVRRIYSEINQNQFQ